LLDLNHCSFRKIGARQFVKFQKRITISDCDQKIAAWQTTVRNAVEEAENALAALTGQKPPNLLNPTVWDSWAFRPTGAK